MEKWIPILKSSQLFAGVEEGELSALLTCLEARPRRYPKGAYVLREGEALHGLPVLVEGSLHIQRDDYWGGRSILGQVGPGELFGEAYVAPGSGPLLNDVVAVAESTVVFFSVERLLTACPSACPFHAAVVRNLLFVLAEKDRQLVRKLGHMSRRTTREKLLSYLSEEAKRQGSSSFSIPFDRQQLADFLSVDRSAMSSALCRMRDEGLLRFHKNQFQLLGGGGAASAEEEGAKQPGPAAPGRRARPSRCAAPGSEREEAHDAHIQ